MTTTLTVRVLLFYVVSMFLILCTVAWNSIKPGTSPFVAALVQVGIPGAALVMNLVVLTAVLSCLNSGLYVTSRVLFALAANGDAPQALVALNRRKVPVRSILTGSAFGYVALIASVVSPTGVFSFLVNASGAAMLLLYLMVGTAQIRHRLAMAPAEVEALGFKMWLFPWLSYTAQMGILAVLIAMAFFPDLRSQLYTTIVFVAVLWLLYFALRKTNRLYLAT
jgi:L-asparagine transporter-like permease